MVLKNDAVSYGRGRTIYGLKGEAVEIISDCGNVVIVKGKNGERFPTPIENISYEEQAILEPIKSGIIEKPVNKINNNRAVKKKSRPTNQTTLF